MMWDGHVRDRRRDRAALLQPRGARRDQRRRSAPTRPRGSRSRSTPQRALLILGLISLSLAVVNLFPFLPLDGGHIFWALAEKVRGRAIPFAVMERASVIGFVLIAILFVIGLENDVDRLRNGEFEVR